MSIMSPPGGPMPHPHGTQGKSKKKEKRRLRDLPRIIAGSMRAFISRLFYIIGLVWKSAPPLLILMIVFCILDGILPIFGAYISRDLLNGIAELITNKSNSSELSDLFTVIEPLLFLFVLNIVYLFLRRLLTRMNTMVTGIAGELVVNQIKLTIMGKAREVDLSSYDKPDFYEKLENANREAGMRPIGILTATFNVISSVISAVSFVAVLTMLSPWAPVLIIIAAVPGAIVNFIYRNKNFRYIRFHSKERRQMNYYSGLMVDKDRVKENKILGLGDTIIDNYKRAFSKYFKGLKKLILREGIVQITIGLISVLVQGALFAYIAYSVISGNGLVGDYSLYSGALSSISGYVLTLLTSTVTIYEGTLFIDNMITFMNEKPEVVSAEKEPVSPMRGIAHTLELCGVSFRYPGTDQYVLRDVNLKIDSSDSVVLVGLNGAGKTTLIKLITRLYDPTEGAIYLDGIDIRRYSPEKYYDLFGIIFQDFGKYAESAKENIRYGDVTKKSTDEEIVSAAISGGADEFIRDLPDGYNTPLTRMFEENGVELSGGQWQKLSVARAFFKESDILILDEPTSSLDPIAEQSVFERYSELSRGKISVFVSHKLSSAVSATKIVVLDGGSVAEVGSHDELMKKKGKYYNLFTVQAHRYTGVDYE